MNSPESADYETSDEGVSPRAAKRLRDAMDRLLAGRPQRTDGRLLKENLWKEADVSRATMNRAARILAEWNLRIAECDGFTPREAHKHDEITTLRRKTRRQDARMYGASPPARCSCYRDRRPASRQRAAA